MMAIQAAALPRPAALRLLLSRVRHGLAAHARRSARHAPFLVVFNASNALNYAFLLAMSAFLRPSDFSLFAALFGGVYLASALANTVQTSIAGIVAAGVPPRTALQPLLSRLLLAMPLVAVGTALVARPAAALVHDDSVVGVVLVVGTLWFFVAGSAGYGALQGLRRFTSLAAALLVASAGRLVLGVALVGAGLGVEGALLGVGLGFVGSSVFAIGAAWSAPSDGRAAVAARDYAPDLMPALALSLAIAIPTSADVLLARHLLDGASAGTYAVVSVLGKAPIFLSLAVATVVYPALVRSEHAPASAARLRRTALATALALASFTAVVVSLTGTFVPGLIWRGYDVQPLLLCAYMAAMAAFAGVLVILHGELARPRRRWFVAATPAALVAELAVIAALRPGPAGMAVVLLVGNLMLLAIGVLRTHHVGDEVPRAVDVCAGPALLDGDRHRLAG